MYCVQVIYFKMPTTVGILKLITRTNDTVCCFERDNCLICWYFDGYEDNRLVYDLGAN